MGLANLGNLWGLGLNMGPATNMMRLWKLYYQLYIDIGGIQGSFFVILNACWFKMVQAGWWNIAYIIRIISLQICELFWKNTASMFLFQNGHESLNSFFSVSIWVVTPVANQLRSLCHVEPLWIDGKHHPFLPLNRCYVMGKTHQIKRFGRCTSPHVCISPFFYLHKLCFSWLMSVDPPNVQTKNQFHWLNPRVASYLLAISHLHGKLPIYAWFTCETWLSSIVMWNFQRLKAPWNPRKDNTQNQFNHVFFSQQLPKTGHPV